MNNLLSCLLRPLFVVKANIHQLFKRKILEIFIILYPYFPALNGRKIKPLSRKEKLQVLAMTLLVTSSGVAFYYVWYMAYQAKMANLHGHH